ncbi:unnamed protein product [Acanthoscelides obtectus]|uniref:PHD-type domain-containing protein n=1 Tax=Acanthoscelides obtectus TaxID=200917 RepID=A0A9P0MNI5_ACAOB|nr:unnamed protein product [Acanthoscelides obtectus]CAK1633072.1 hypothetical protein AOBTE_LOCUS7924 [Acanthoscelides obtectus]
MATNCASCHSLVNRSKPGIPCDGFCEQSFHISCVGIPSDVLKIIKTPGLFWYCPTCSQQKKDFDRVFIKIDDKVDTLIADVYNIFSEAKGHLINKVDETLEQTVSQRVPGPSASYANTLKKTVNVIVTPKNNDQSHSATRLRISQSVDPVDNNIRFSQVKNIKNGGILIKCDGSDDANKLKDLASRHLSADYEVKEVRKFNPRLKIVGMSQCIEKEELCTMLKSQNNAFHAESECSVLKVWPTKKSATVYQAILDVDCTTYANVLNQGLFAVCQNDGEQAALGFIDDPAPCCCLS